MGTELGNSPAECSPGGFHVDRDVSYKAVCDYCGQVTPRFASERAATEMAEMHHLRCSSAELERLRDELAWLRDEARRHATAGSKWCDPVGDLDRVLSGSLGRGRGLRGRVLAAREAHENSGAPHSAAVAAELNSLLDSRELL